MTRQSYFVVALAVLLVLVGAWFAPKSERLITGYCVILSDKTFAGSKPVRIIPSLGLYDTVRVYLFNGDSINYISIQEDSLPAWAR